MRKYQDQLKKLRTMYSTYELSLQLNVSISHLYNLLSARKMAGDELKEKIDRLHSLTFPPEQKPKYKNRVHNKINAIINIYLPIVIILGAMGVTLYLIINLY